MYIQQLGKVLILNDLTNTTLMRSVIQMNLCCFVSCWPNVIWKSVYFMKIIWSAVQLFRAPDLSARWGLLVWYSVWFPDCPSIPCFYISYSFHLAVFYYCPSLSYLLLSVCVPASFLACHFLVDVCHVYCECSWYCSGWSCLNMTLDCFLCVPG